METYLSITQINDFMFCPRSLLFHDFLRSNFSPDKFRETPQIQGLASHAAIDSAVYSTRSDVLQGSMVYSSKYKLLGRIDLFFVKSGLLRERKYSITAVYDGFRYQLYAQYFALREIGYAVRRMELYSSKDNRKYPVDLPDKTEIYEFERILESIRAYDPGHDTSPPNLVKCRHCNYREICIYFPEEERE